MVVSVQSGSIYLVTTEGKVIQLSNGSWTELQNECNPELRIKRISCSSHSLWAICGEHQVNARLLESDVPIRIKYETYENERWNPVDGFCSKLLPTDRPTFSSEDGLTSLPFSAIQLPSIAWIWDDQWHLDLLHEEQHLEAEVNSLFILMTSPHKIFHHRAGCTRLISPAHIHQRKPGILA